MKEFKGTQGPWGVDVNGVDARWNIDSLNGDSVAITNQIVGDKNWSIRDANTRLIAAAPDLLEAIQIADRVMSAGRNASYPDWYGAINKARSAISKALGEE
jgi:hypothetical protein